MIRFAAAFLILIFLAGGVQASPDQAPPKLLILSSGALPPGKIARMADWAGEAGVRLDSIHIETAPGEPEEWIKDADLVVMDSLRSIDRARLQDRLGPALARSTVPWILTGGGAAAESGHLDPDHAGRLSAYYENGGADNLRAMLAYIRAWRGGGDMRGMLEPRVLPQAGFYHQDAPRLFAGIGDYLAWGKTRWPASAPRIAFAIHASAIANMQTAIPDRLIAGTEARGMIPLVFWFDAADPEALRRAFADARPDILVNLQHMQNGAARSAEFLALDIPVLQTLTYRQGDPGAWRAAASGVPQSMTAPFLSLPESWGMSDPLVIDAIRDGAPAPMEDQIDALLDKAASLAALRRTPATQKRLGLMFWNYPPGEKNLSASHLNLPRSLERLTRALAEAGYDVPPTGEDRFIAAGQAMLGGFYRPETLETLLKDGLAEAFPLARYRAWFDRLPDASRAMVLKRWGEPEQSWAVREIGGEKQFIIPRLRLGNLIVMPQPPRANRPGEAHHDLKLPPNHLYLAAYLYLREEASVHALIHLGTHGTQEWTPGKDRGLWTGDFPFLAVGSVPVFYPYIQDNVGEAIQARRRGRAVVVSHQTPPFAPAGLYDELRDLHALIHEYGQLAEGMVRDATMERIKAAVLAGGMHRDLGWTEEAMAADFDGFLAVLHDHLHELAGSATPLGLHNFGEPGLPEHRLTTIMQQLGKDYLRHAGVDPEEAFAADFEALRTSRPYLLLQRHLRENVPLDSIADPALRADLVRAAELDRHLAEPGEIEALLAGLAGRFVAPGPGGDPVRNPDVPSGRNLYAFEPDKIPTPAAYEAGGKAFEALLAAYRDGHEGQDPEKLAFSLWSSEALRHLGVLESQVLHALGLRPVWDKGGRVTALEIVPAAELGRPRIDAVIQVTSVYRDQFDGFMRLLADAIDRLSRLDEPGNKIAANSARLASELAAQGMAADEARKLAALRLFGNEPGDYGSGLPDMVRRSESWSDESALAEHFLSRMQYAYGARDWGIRVKGNNLLKRQLKGVQAAVLARSSTLHGVLSTDHPFEYLGGLGLAVRHLDGASPELYIADLRKGEARITTAARFVADEMRTRTLNPHWIGAMQREGYAGTLAVLDAVNNVWGWQATAPETVRADQWQAIHDTFVRDARGLDMDGWFEQHNPAAQAQLIERLMEAVRKGYWDAPDETKRELAERWQALKAAYDTGETAAVTQDFIERTAAGFGLDAPRAADDSGAPPDAQDAQPAPGNAQPVQGQILEPTPPSAEEDPAFWRFLPGLALLLCLLGGALRQTGFTFMTPRKTLSS